jgi:hydrogenase nickel incorporation protein HypB
LEIKVNEKILSKNDQIALETARLLARKKILCLNMMSSPGSGKTSILEKAIPLLKARLRPGVLEGDVATQIDAQRIEKSGIPVVQITTDTFGGSCHLSAKMVADRIGDLPLDSLDLVIVENVGNLICPAGFQIGADLDVAVVSLTEGPEKPLKYPAIFQKSHLVIINKIDLAQALDVTPGEVADNVKKISPLMECLFVSAKTGEGIDRWVDWICQRVGQKKQME